VDPAGLKGLWLRARSGPARDRFLEGLSALPAAPLRLHPAMTDEALLGGVDLTATLSTGRVVMRAGLLERGSIFVLAMAERCPPGVGARLAQALDRDGPCLIALDEAAEPDEGPPAAIVDRLGLFVALDGLSCAEIEDPLPDPAAMAAARARLPSVETPEDAAAALAIATARLGVASLRAPLLALAAARAAAALAGRGAVTEADLALAVALTCAHRAAPESDEAPDQPDAPPPPPPEGEQDAPPAEGAVPPEEMLVEAARAAIPADLLESLAAGRAARAAKGAGGSGAARKGGTRGRPLPSRPGSLGAGARIDLVATLRTAAPWQPLRRASMPAGARIAIRADDIRIRRYQETTDRLLIFTVDASGSSAMTRLGEAKGAVELLLGQAYSRRDHVALAAFRGKGAELLLPPTRSLVQAKRRLAGLPGGGGTPLAAGLALALAIATQAKGRGMTPTVALLTDGRANVALSGAPGREAAEADAEQVARALRAAGAPALVIDTGPRPQPSLRALARTLDAPYLALPRADAHRLSAALSAALGD
jgi:magnesium chelatase subunit D